MSGGHPVSSLDDVVKAMRNALSSGKTGEGAVHATQDQLREAQFSRARAEADTKHAKAAEAARAKTGGNLVRDAAMQAANAQRQLDYRAASDEYMRS